MAAIARLTAENLAKHNQQYTQNMCNPSAPSVHTVCNPSAPSVHTVESEYTIHTEESSPPRIEQNPSVQVSNNQKVLHWICAPQQDSAFYGKNIKKNRKWVRQNQFNDENYRIFKSTVDFFNYVEQEAKKDNPSKIGILILSGHGNLFELGNLEASGNSQVVVKHPGIPQDKQRTLFSKLNSLLERRSIVVLDACLTGNKSSKKGNFAQVVSKVLSHSLIFASQYETEDSPGIHLRRSLHRTQASITFGVEMRKKYGSPIVQTPSVIYLKGTELTHQEAVPLKQADILHGV